MEYYAEWTDTYGGEARYSWVRRATIEATGDISDCAILRRAKRELGISGVKGRAYYYGGMIEFRPYRMCCVMFIYALY
jgi:hypothetical protein